LLDGRASVRRARMGATQGCRRQPEVPE
jgi:hypothetical protein